MALAVLAQRASPSGSGSVSPRCLALRGGALKALGSASSRIGVRASNGGNARRFVEAVLWMAHTRAYWSDIPVEYGAWHAIYIRFGRWAHEGVWGDVIKALEELPETRALLGGMVDKYLASYRIQRLRGRMK